MIVLGIDPGSRITGYGLVQSQRGSLVYLGSGCIHVGDGALADKLKVIYTAVLSLIEQYHPDVMAIEETFLSKNVQSTVKLSEARASAILAGAMSDLMVYEYTPMQIKQAVVGTGGADKQQVQYMVRMILSLSGLPQTDAADALACAICHANTYNVTSQMGSEVANGSSVRGRLRSK
ncbi:MAG: crossover junction endodeoxyribonuclease RuvC [Succinivibrio sp.]|nr:crossover junction endodeoxyribonuclease RuvC [Succinivibrio sp.]